MESRGSMMIHRIKKISHCTNSSLKDSPVTLKKRIGRLLAFFS